MNIAVHIISILHKCNLKDKAKLNTKTSKNDIVNNNNYQKNKEFLFSDVSSYFQE